jgi:hypothetical protein
VWHLLLPRLLLGLQLLRLLQLPHPVPLLQPPPPLLLLLPALLLQPPPLLLLHLLLP